MRREEGDERLFRAPGSDDRLDGEFRMELGGRADGGQHGVAVTGGEKLLQRRAIALRIAGHGQVMHAGELDAMQPEAIDHRRGAAARGGDHRDLWRPP